MVLLWIFFSDQGLFKAKNKTQQQNTTCEQAQKAMHGIIRKIRQLTS